MATQTADNVDLRDQKWELTEEVAGGTVIRSGDDFAALLVQLGCHTHNNARQLLAHSNIGDCINTGVSAYVRIK